MDKVFRQDPHAEEIARIRGVIERHALPDFIDGFDVELGLSHGERAAWITFKLAGNDDIGLEELERRADVLLPLQEELFDELAEAGDERFPFFRVSYSATPQNAY